VGPDAQAPESEDTGSGVGWWLIALVTLAGLVLGGGLVFGILRTRGRGATGS
jgi:hypothetical protein